jgi:hypothetical protein
MSFRSGQEEGEGGGMGPAKSGWGGKSVRGSWKNSGLEAASWENLVGWMCSWPSAFFLVKKDLMSIWCFLSGLMGGVGDPGIRNVWTQMLFTELIWMLCSYCCLIIVLMRCQGQQESKKMTIPHPLSSTLTLAFRQLEMVSTGASPQRTWKRAMVWAQLAKPMSLGDPERQQFQICEKAPMKSPPSRKKRWGTNIWGGKKETHFLLSGELYLL